MCKGRTAVSVGKFECLHRGHQKLLHNIKKQNTYGMTSTVITIELPGKQQVLLEEERKELLKQKGIDRWVSMPLDRQLMEMEPEVFVREILVNQFRAGYVTAGLDFRFGRNRKGDGQLLEEMGKQYGFEVTLVEKEWEQGREISSSWIREALLQGNLPLVNGLLGYEYFLTGQVAYGNQIGRRLGMPTVNMEIPAEKLVPPAGVYMSKTLVKGKIYESITNLGLRPTIQEEKKSLRAETFLYDFHQEIYGQPVQVKLLYRVRQEQQFGDLDQLKQQIRKDMEWGREFFAEKRKR